VAPSCRVSCAALGWSHQSLNTSTDYFTKLLEDDLKAVVKPQYVDQIPRAIRTPDKSVKALLEGRASLQNLDEVVDTLGTFAPFSIKPGSVD
jgi:ATP-binding cassette subfamily E protein 1